MGRVRVRQTRVSVGGKASVDTPKSRKARVIDLDADTVDALRRHKMAQAQERLAWGPGYQASGLVFTRPDGSGVHPDVFSDAFRNVVAASGVRRTRLHDLRHTHASLLLAAGVPVKVVTERLGHASPAFTMAVYQHLLPSMQAEAAAIAALVNGARRDPASGASEA